MKHRAAEQQRNQDLTLQKSIHSKGASQKNVLKKILIYFRLVALMLRVATICFYGKLTRHNLPCLCNPLNRFIPAERQHYFANAGRLRPT